MIRIFLILVFFGTAAVAQDFSGLARVDASRSVVQDVDDALHIDLKLSQVVPFRVFTVAEPNRLIVDFREVDWTGVLPDELLRKGLAKEVRFGRFQPGWSRLVLELAEPLAVRVAGMKTDEVDGTAQLNIVMEPVDIQYFISRSGAPMDALWGTTLPTPALRPKPRDDGPLVVVIDPGHGGIDPGAHHGGELEANIMLQLGIEVAEALNRAGGVRALLTRDADVFVPLAARMTFARANHADLLISLHADALEQGQARGASVYTLSKDASDLAAQRMAERHERGDILAGLDFTGQEDRIAGVLMDLARLETGPKSKRFAEQLVTQFRSAGARLHRRPLREGQLAVLNAADFASVLVEVGFLSNAKDREMLLDPELRRPIIDGIVAAVLIWALDEEARMQ